MKCVQNPTYVVQLFLQLNLGEITHYVFSIFVSEAPKCYKLNLQ